MGARHGLSTLSRIEPPRFKWKPSLGQGTPDGGRISAPEPPKAIIPGLLELCPLNSWHRRCHSRLGHEHPRVHLQLLPTGNSHPTLESGSASHPGELRGAWNSQAGGAGGATGDREGGDTARTGSKPHTGSSRAAGDGPGWWPGHGGDQAMEVARPWRWPGHAQTMLVASSCHLQAMPTLILGPQGHPERPGSCARVSQSREGRASPDPRPGSECSACSEPQLGLQLCPAAPRARRERAEKRRERRHVQLSSRLSEQLRSQSFTTAAGFSSPGGISRPRPGCTCRRAGRVSLHSHTGVLTLTVPGTPPSPPGGCATSAGLPFSSGGATPAPTRLPGPPKPPLPGHGKSSGLLLCFRRDRGSLLPQEPLTLHPKAPLPYLR